MYKNLNLPYFFKRKNKKSSMNNFRNLSNDEFIKYIYRSFLDSRFLI